MSLEKIIQRTFHIKANQNMPLHQDEMRRMLNDKKGRKQPDSVDIIRVDQVIQGPNGSVVVFSREEYSPGQKKSTESNAFLCPPEGDGGKDFFRLSQREIIALTSGLSWIPQEESPKELSKFL